jgi:hypothetical protein
MTNPAATNIAKKRASITAQNDMSHGVAMRGRLNKAAVPSIARNAPKRLILAFRLRSEIQPQKKYPSSHPRGGIHSTVPIST